MYDYYLNPLLIHIEFCFIVGQYHEKEEKGYRLYIIIIYKAFNFDLTRRSLRRPLYKLLRLNLVQVTPLQT